MDMKKIVIALIASFTLTTANAQTLRCATFNIRYANGDRGTRNDWKLRRDSLARFVRAADISVCGMQEVLEEQWTDLQQRLPEYEFVGVGRDDGKRRGEYAPVVFRRDEWRAIRSGTFWLSPTPDEVGSKGWDAALPRIATWALLEHRTQHTQMIFVSTHFDHVGQQARVESGKLILRRVREIAGELPLVLTGDFNVGMESPVYHSITHDPDYPLLDSYMMGAPHKGVNYTFQGFARKPIERCDKIDFVFVSPNIGVVATEIPAESRESEALVMSDHNPIITTIRLK